MQELKWRQLDSLYLEVTGKIMPIGAIGQQ